VTPTTKWHDSVVAEIHATRERLAEQYHHDLLAYSEAAEAHCRALELNMAADRHHAAQIARMGLAIAGPAPPCGPPDATPVRS